MVFDKTGTLTEEGLEVYGFKAINKIQRSSRYKFTQL